LSFVHRVVYRQFFWASVLDVTSISSVFLFSSGIISVQVANKIFERTREVSMEPLRWVNFRIAVVSNTVGALGHLEFYSWFFASTIMQGLECVHVCLV